MANSESMKVVSKANKTQNQNNQDIEQIVIKYRSESKSNKELWMEDLNYYCSEIMNLLQNKPDNCYTSVVHIEHNKIEYS